MADIFKACETGDLAEVEKLLAAGGNVNATNNYNNTPLHLASENGHQEIVKVLLAAEGNVNIKNNKSETPATLASSS